MKTLSDILYKVPLTAITGRTDIPVTKITADSRECKEGSLFAAVPGTLSDGHRFIGAAIAKGAVAVLCEVMPENLQERVTYVRVGSSALALGIAADNFYDHPSQQCSLVGVTGTNGKTTIASLSYQVFRRLGFKCGLISTVEVRINDRMLPSTHTTPDAVSLNRLLSEMATAGCDYVFMEVSSHAVVQERIAGLTFAGGIFTNLTHDHLDYHQTFDNYLKAKKKFFDDLPKSAFALINSDDRNGRVMVQNTRATVSAYGLQSMADFRGKILESQIYGTKMVIGDQEVWSRLTGSFNAYNFLAVYAIAVNLGQDPAAVLQLMSDLGAVEGRFDWVRSADGITAIVDYAHTPDAVKNVLTAIRGIRTGQEAVITVIGAGGDRDHEKRPVMAGIACEMSDKVILTSDNPRSEEPEDILAEMRKGLDPVQLRKVLTIVNRREAIAAACQMARPGDIVLVAGKGHEKYQEIKGIKYPFDDKQVLREYLRVPEEENN